MSTSPPANNAPQPIPPPTAQQPFNWRMWSKVTGWVVVAVVTGLFLFRNSNTVEVDLVFSSVEMPLFVALLIAVVLGAVLGSGLMMLRARAKSKAATAKAKK